MQEPVNANHLENPLNAPALIQEAIDALNRKIAWCNEAGMDFVVSPIYESKTGHIRMQATMHGIKQSWFYNRMERRWKM
jgi:hypothetical protein